MNRAILFWFYKEPSVCQNRLRLLREYNPATSIFGLYGGDPAQKSLFETATAPYLDDFYGFDIDKDPDWKWRHGDLMIAQWHRDRGSTLKWSSIVIVQWDMLVLENVKQLFAEVPEDQILLSGYEPIGSNDSFSPWIAPPARRNVYEDFLRHVANKYSFHGQPYRCLFVVVCFPRSFLDKYSSIDCPELGFIEYRVPIYAQIFQTPVSRASDSFKASWQERNPLRRTISPRKQPIPLSIILWHLVRANGARVFHPYHDVFVLQRPTRYSVVAAMLRDIPVLTKEVGLRVRNIVKRFLHKRK